MVELSQRLANLTPAQRQLLEQRLKKKPDTHEPIAIVGMSCRFAGAPNIDAYWRLIRDAIDGTGEIPGWRWDVDGLYDPTGEEAGKMSTKWAGMVDGVDQFDPMFFGISPREAARMDPQQRMLLEVAWEAFEMAGIAPDQMTGSATGVFVGIGGTDYSKIPCQFDDYYEFIDAHVGTGNALSIAANRVSYIFDLRGPSIAVDTACSSGMMGVHLAVQSLRSRECDAALAGGVNAILTPETTIAFSKAQMLSPEGKCRPFDHRANGYVRGEGCGILVLKRLTDATRDGDNVLALIRGSATNQDGRTSGITAPNGLSQQKVIRAALRQAGLSLDDVSYIEAHGTGTPLGDPIEVEALGHLFRGRGAHAPTCHISSVKANIGHTETVSGVAGIIKTVLMMQHKTIPKQVHFEQLNQHISLENTRLRIPEKAIDWDTGGHSRIAGVSSFGFGGANTHVVLEEASPAEPITPSEDRPQHLLVLSAKSQSSVNKVAEVYCEFLDSNPDISIDDVCHSANTGRSHFNHRVAVTAAEHGELHEKLASLSGGRAKPGVKSAQVKLAGPPKVAFLFTGQGSQYVGMGRELYQTQPTFRKTLDECDEILRDHLKKPLLSVMHSDDPSDPTIDETAYTQPALFAIEYALATLWRSWGIEPNLVIGHSVGEYVAATISGAMSLEDGLGLIAMRARLMQDLPRNGLMAVVFAPADQVTQKLKPYEDKVSIAAANGPENTVISGLSSAVEEIVAQFQSAEVKTQLLTVSHAFHSPLMDPILDEFEMFASKVDYQRPTIPIVSNLTGELLEDEPPRAGYWRNHIRNTVRFADGMNQLARQGVHVMLETGPAPILVGMGRRCLPDSEASWLPSLRKGQCDWKVMLSSLSDLYIRGAKVDWGGFDRDWTRKRLVLPTYPFDKKRFWFDQESKPAAFSGNRGPVVHPLLGSRVQSALESKLFEGRLSSRWPKFLVDHQVQGSPVVPAAAYVEQGLAAAEQLFGDGSHALENIAIQNAMFLPDGQTRVVQVTLSPEMGGESTFDTYSTSADSESAELHWSLNACGKLRHADTLPGDQPAAISLDEVRERVIDIKTREEFYDLMYERGLSYGPAFQVLSDLRRGREESVSRIDLPESVQRELEEYHLHPALGDALFQSVAGVIPLEEDGSYSPYTYLPMGIRRVRIHKAFEDEMFVYAKRISEGDMPSPESVEADLSLVDASGNVLVELLGIQVQRIGRAATGKHEVDPNEWLYQIEWESESLPQGDLSQDTAIENWLVFADNAGVGEQLVNVLKETGAQSTIVVPGADFSHAPGENSDADVYTIDPLNGDHYQQFLQQTFGNLQSQPDRAGIVHLWSLDVQIGDDGLDKIRSHSCGSVLQLIRQIARARLPVAPSLCLVTQGAQRLDDDTTTHRVSVGQSALWGLGRVCAVEHPELSCRIVDLDPAYDKALAATSLSSELNSKSGDSQVAYRAESRYVARLRRDRDALTDESNDSKTLTVPQDAAFRLRIAEPGSFDSLWFESTSRTTPDAGQVELEVRASGLNFSDVLKAMGLYPGITDAIVPLGIECSGVVTAVGEGVDRFKKGDAVMGVAPYSFASHARTADYALVRKPANITDCQAATIPITFLTAHYALVRLAQLQPGERLLIHAGAGGVGLAAIQIAQHIGAEIFATAGSDEKRDVLRSLGVQYVFNSRTLDFADQIMDVTKREGVDVVLNSLPGDAITKSLAILRAYGRFLEIGKTDIYKNSMIGLAPFQDNLSYFAIDLDRMLRQRSDYIRSLFAEVMEYFEREVYKPLRLTEFAIDGTVDAFRYMAQRKNIGKVVVSLERETASSVDDQVSQPQSGVVRGDGTYLITGGLGALGLRVAEWLAEKGAGCIALLSRRAPSDEAASKIEQLNSKGVQVLAVQADVGDFDSLTSALEGMPDDCPPIRGVIHAAGVLADGILFDMEMDQFDRAMLPKVQGAWNLHRATQDMSLDFFAMFSSVASVLGSPGQGNYAAGNAFLDGLAHYRRSIGMPATSINWGPWAESGMAAEAGRDQQIKSRGMDLIPPDHGLTLLGKFLERGTANITVMDAHWSDMFNLMSGRTPSLLADLADSEVDASNDLDDAVDHELRSKLLGVSADERESMFREFFSDELARIMGLEPSDLDQSQPLNELGMDSLLAMELKNNLERRLAFTIPMAAFMETPSISTLSQHAANALVEAGRSDGAAGATPGTAETWTPLSVLQPSGEESPLFCIHPLGGDVSCYFEFARNVTDRPVYGLRGRGSEGSLDPHRDIEEMARTYLEAIKSVQATGPYLLASWSAGGIYTYEVARLLREAGDEIKLLAWFDTPLPSIYKDVDVDDDVQFLFDLGNFANWFSGSDIDIKSLPLDEMREMDEQSRWQLATEIAKSQNAVPPDANADYVRHICQAGQSHARMIKTYAVQAIDQDVHLIRPESPNVLAEMTGQTLSQDLGWKGVIGDRLKLHVSSGDHFSMLQGENAARLSDVVSNLIHENESAGS